MQKVPMKRISFQVPEEWMPRLNELVAACNEASMGYEEGVVPRLTLSSLFAMLASDCEHAIRRPGSWEGANMLQVLSSHGYQL